MGDGDEVCQFGFEDGVEVFGCADGDKAVGICEVRKDTDLVGVFELQKPKGVRKMSLGEKERVGVSYLCSDSHDCLAIESLLGWMWFCRKKKADW